MHHQLISILLLAVVASSTCGEKHVLRVVTENGFEVGLIEYYDNAICDESILILSENKPANFFNKLREFQQQYVETARA